MKSYKLWMILAFMISAENAQAEIPVLYAPWACNTSYSISGFHSDDYSKYALDFNQTSGIAVVAPLSGTVTHAKGTSTTHCAIDQSCPNAGNWVTIKLDKYPQYSVMFYHLKANSVTVKAGDHVEQGQKVAEIGDTGRCNGAHMHVQVQRNDQGCTDYSCQSVQFGFVETGGKWPTSAITVKSQNCPVSCTPSTEICDGKDNDCDSLVDEDGVCNSANDEVAYQSYAYGPYSSDINGDGKADLCAREAKGFGCKLSNGTGFGNTVKLIEGMSNDNDYADSTNVYYRTIRMADINGDKKADICGRSASAYVCFPSTDDGFGAQITGPAMSNDAFKDPKYYTTIRMADINGDGKADICARYSDGFKCALSKGTEFGALGTAVVGLSDANGFSSEQYYATIRMADINGDGKDDLCNLEYGGFVCRLSDGSTFPSGNSKISGPEWKGSSKIWSNPVYYTTIRMPDINGDRMADVCARDPEGLVCYLSEKEGFSKTPIRGDWPDKDGWNDYRYYSTIQFADLNNDGKDDVCARANAGLVCYLSTGTAFTSKFELPHFSDDNGYNDPMNFRTIRFADMDDDGNADVCGRNSTGVHCFKSNGTSFGSEIKGPEWSDANGWNEAIYTTTIRFGGPRISRCISAQCPTEANADSMQCKYGSCIIQTCKAGYDLSSDGKSCIKAATTCDRGKCAKPEHAETMLCSNNKCVVQTCENGYVVSDDRQICSYVAPCEASLCPKAANASEMACSDQNECIIGSCAPGYDISSDKLTCAKTVTCSDTDCTLADGARAMACQNGKCVISECSDSYELSADGNTCIINKPSCRPSDCPVKKNAVEMTCENDACAISLCADGYDLSSDKLSCAAHITCSATECSLAEGASAMACDNDKCVIAKCSEGFELSSDKQNCSATATACNPTECAVSAHAGSMTCENDQCVIADCSEGYELSADRFSCIKPAACTASNCALADNAAAMTCENDRCVIAQCKNNYILSDDKASCTEQDSPNPPTDTSCAPASDKEEICDDGIDNDCDGDTDTADSDCKTALTPNSSADSCSASTRIPTDFPLPAFIFAIGAIFAGLARRRRQRDE